MLYPLQAADRHPRRITLNIFNPRAEEQDNLLTLEIFPDMTLSTLRESIQAEANVPPTSQHIYHNGRLISDGAKTMEQLEISDGEMLAVHVRDMRSNAAGGTGQQPQPQLQQQQQQQQPQPQQRTPAAAAAPAPGSRGPQGDPNDPELARLQILGNPALRERLQSQHPELAAAVDDPARFAQILHASQDREQRERLERQREIERLNDDPFDIEAQRKIEEMIRQERVMENLQNAMEHNPEGIFSALKIQSGN
jgi:DNA damage-inducible protein 1